MFGTILITFVSLMHLYVAWRAAAVPWIVRRVPRGSFWIGAAVLWLLFYLGRVVGHDGTGRLAATLELLGMTWMAVVFLLFVPLLAVDLLTLFGLLWRRRASTLRGGALVVGALLAAVALVQGLRPPVVETYEVALPGLPAQADGTVLVALSDLHLGSQLGGRWLAARVAQVQALQPDLLVLLGDIFEGHGPPDPALTDVLGGLSAPLGVWAVPGNHEFHGKGGMQTMARAGVQLLRNRWVAVRPGLILAGVDDLTRRRRNGQGGEPAEAALAGRPPGAAILLSHTPWQADAAARAGAGLMLSGHTHGGQIWPFDYLVARRYPLLEGRYTVAGMPVLVSRGTGTWGPRMRLWHPGVILHVTLRAADP